MWPQLFINHISNERGDILKKSIDVVEIARQIELKGSRCNFKNENKGIDWRPIKVESYTVPPFVIPDSQKRGETRKRLSKVLAFIELIKQKRYKDACTIIPIPEKDKRLISICGSQRNASNFIKFMKNIGLIEIESDEFRFNSRTNKCKTYRYYVENEKEIQGYCEENNIMKYMIHNDTLIERFSDIDSFDKSQVRISSKLLLLKPKKWGPKDFENNLISVLYENYPQLHKYQRLADSINEEYYKDYPDLWINFRPSFTWNKGNKAVRKIGIRATNALVSASNKSREESSVCFNGKYKEEIREQYGLHLEKDVKSSVPRLTLSLNCGYWISENIDMYEKIWEVYKGKKESIINDTLIERFSDVRNAIKSLHMRGYFDSAKRLGVNTRNAMYEVVDGEAVDKEMAIFREALIEVEGGHVYDSEIFLHESCIYMDVLKKLLDEGYFVWECYDSWYSRKDGVTQTEYGAHVAGLVEKCANQYIAKLGLERDVWNIA